MTTPGIERLTRLAFRNGAIGLRTCGAGGGGCVAILVQPRKAGAALMKKIEELGMRGIYAEGRSRNNHRNIGTVKDY